MKLCAWLLVAAGMLAGADASAAEIVIGEVSVASAPLGVDKATVKSAAEREIKALDASRVRRRVVMSLAVVGATDAPVAVSVNALLRDGRTGNIIAVVEGRARAEGGGNVELREAVLRAAVRSAVRQIPVALSGG